MNPEFPSVEDVIRPIETADDAAVAGIIRQVMSEFGAVGCRFSSADPEVDAMTAAYAGPRSAFFVIERAGRVLGCGGMGPLAGGDPDVCELRKMYFLPELRGCGLGSELLERILEAARASGYRRCYLETLEHMYDARRLYLRRDFQSIDAPLGHTGHSGCNHWMVRTI